MYSRGISLHITSFKDEAKVCPSRKSSVGEMHNTSVAVLSLLKRLSDLMHTSASV